MKRLPVIAMTIACSAEIVAPVGAPAQVSRSVGSDLVAVPWPPSDQMEAAVQRQLSTHRAELERLLSAGEPFAPEVAQAYGALGELYLLYDLLEPAEVCLRNAHSLAPREADWLYLLGTLLQQQRRLEEAAELFRLVLSLRPEDVPSLLRLGEMEHLLGAVEAAEGRFRQALSLRPRSAAAYQGLARAAVARDEMEEAAAHFERALELQPAATSLHYPLAMAYRELGREEEMHRHLSLRGSGKVAFWDPLSEAVVGRSAGVGARLTLARMARKAGELERAEALAEAAISEDPDSPEARHFLADLLRRQGRASEALEQYRRAAGLEPENPRLHFAMASVLADEGRAEEAIDALRRGLEVAPDFVAGHEELGDRLLDAGRPGEAVESYRRALKLDPEASAARRRIVDALESQGKRLEALAELDVLRAEHPEDGGLGLRRASLLRALGRSQEAAAEYRRLLEHPLPQFQGLSHFHLGNLLAEDRGSWEKAIEHFRVADATLTGMVEARFNLATLLGRLRRFGEAASEYRRVLELEPDHRTAWISLATAHLLAGNELDARGSLEEALDRLGDEPQLRHTLARVLAAATDAAVRDGDRALGLARGLFDSDPGVEAAETLALALASSGRFAQAVELQRRVVDVYRRASAGARLATAQRCLLLYESGSLCLAPWLSPGSSE